MKTIKFFALAAAMLCAAGANAKIWRINYDDNAKADFKTLKEACEHVSVAEGDTLYCEAGNHNGTVAENTISRTMTVFGPGYGFAPNYGNTSTLAGAAFTKTITIKADKVHLAGLCAYKIEFGAKTDGVTIERCKIVGYFVNGNAPIYVGNYDCSNLTIKDNYIEQLYYSNNSARMIGRAISIWGSSTGEQKSITITNNIIKGSVYLSPSTEANISNVLIQNNTIVGAFSTSSSAIYTANSVIQDNIIINTSNVTYVMDFDKMTGNIIRKNVFSLSALNINSYISENHPDNYYVAATEDNTFTKTEKSYGFEEYYRLLDSSAAKNAAYDGSDCGAFGGTNPYVLCGRPQGVPYIYDVEVPAYPTNDKLNVSFKVTGQNE